MLSWLFSGPLAIGSAAPDFTLPDQDGTPVTLSRLRGKNVVLVFYPADETRVCRQQLCEFRDMDQLASDRGVLVYGINPGSAQSHSSFRNKQKLPFPLLVDADKRVASLYHAWTDSEADRLSDRKERHYPFCEARKTRTGRSVWLGRCPGVGHHRINPKSPSPQ